jgi:hypothetical protein
MNCTTMLSVGGVTGSGTVQRITADVGVVLQIEDNIASLKFLDKLTPEVMTKIDEIFGNKPDGVKTYFSYN